MIKSSEVIFFLGLFLLFLLPPVDPDLGWQWRCGELVENFRLEKKGAIILTLILTWNPFGGKIIQEAWQHFAKVPLEKLIAEWVPPQPQKWGGFLIWQLPEYKVFVDGRMPTWPTPSGKSPYTIYLETLQTQPKKFRLARGSSRQKSSGLQKIIITMTNFYFA